MEVKASLNYLHMAPRKVRLAACLLKGMSVDRAQVVLRHLAKRSALPLAKLLASALANASGNFKLDKATLYVKDIRVNPGPVLKRFRPRAFGRAATIRRRMSHVDLVLESTTNEEKKKSGRRPAETGAWSVSGGKAKDMAIRDATREDREIVAAQPLKRKGGVEHRTPQKPQKMFGTKPRVFRRKAI